MLLLTLFNPQCKFLTLLGIFRAAGSDAASDSVALAQAIGIGAIIIGVGVGGMLTGLEEWGCRSLDIAVGVLARAFAIVVGTLAQRPEVLVAACNGLPITGTCDGQTKSSAVGAF